MTSKIKNEYGDENFKIYYNKKLIGQAGIFKTNWWHTHDYFFRFFRTKTNISFDFNVKGPDHKSLYFKHFEFDSLNRKSTEIFYDSKGKTGQINITYFDKQGNIFADELWKDGFFVNMNTYSNGNWLKNYSTYNYSKTEKYKLLKLNHAESLVYIYQTVKDDNITNERIVIKY